MDVKKSDALATGKWITEHLSGSYACLNAGKTVRPALHLNGDFVRQFDLELGHRVTSGKFYLPTHRARIRRPIRAPRGRRGGIFRRSVSGSSISVSRRRAARSEKTAARR